MQIWKRLRSYETAPNQEQVLMIASLTGLFIELDRQPDLGVTNYGVSMTTLEDVFLRLEAETEVDQAGKCVSPEHNRNTAV